MKAIVYHEDYNKYDLGTIHPLVGNKPRKTMDFLKKKKIINELETFTAEKAEDKDLLRVHDTAYIDHIKKLSKTGGWLASDTPAPKGIYEYARLATGGTILAGKKLFEGYDCTANPLAGFHHASRNFSSGFCFFNDIAVVIEHLKEEKNLQRFAIVDLDVHHGNGTQEIYYSDKTVLNISIHQDGRTLYPGTGSIDKIGKNNGEGYTINLPLPPKTSGKSYLYAFESFIPSLLMQFDPEVIIYQCGVDTHHSDPLADLNVTYQTYFRLAQKMRKISSETCNKLLVLFGGGYNSNSSVYSYYNIMSGLLGKKQYVKEEEKKQINQKEIELLVKQLKNIISSWWKL